MNLVQTLPGLQVARLGNLHGMGYAEVTSKPGEKEECRGVIIFDEDVDINNLPEGSATFEGVVYRQQEESFESLRVDILLVNADPNQEAGATFVSR